jgi:hypothetical protein
VSVPVFLSFVPFQILKWAGQRSREIILVQRRDVRMSVKIGGLVGFAPSMCF